MTCKIKRRTAVVTLSIVALLCSSIIVAWARFMRSTRAGASAITSVSTHPPLSDFTDSYGDGTPDFVRLSSEPDRQAFRRWFAFLAEAQYYRRAPLPDEIDDCAALLRFAYREALRHHDGDWASAMALQVAPAIPPVAKYEFPHTPLGAGIFRVRDGQSAAEDLRDGAFAEFADANTLRRFNTYFVSREVRAAQRGDLLFFRQFGQSSPYHAMIFLGRSQFEPGPESYVVYHTGPIGKSAGEIRRLALSELFAHPEARWHPVRGNPAFLGVYRWNILRGAD